MRAPWATLALAGACAAIYLAGFARAGTAVLPPKLLLELGALPVPTATAELWRLLTAPLVHIDTLHLLGNGALLLLVGPPLERRHGAGALLLLFWLGGLVGGVAALGYYRSAPTVVAGASGALCALLLGGTGSHSPWLRYGGLAGALALLGTGLLSGDHTASAAHLGGAAVGTLAALRSRRRA